MNESGGLVLLVEWGVKHLKMAREGVVLSGPVYDPVEIVTVHKQNFR